MELLARLDIKKALQSNKDISLGLIARIGSNELETAIKSLSEKTKLSEVFIRQNLSIIRNWTT